MATNVCVFGFSVEMKALYIERSLISFFTHYVLHLQSLKAWTCIAYFKFI